MTARMTKNGAYNLRDFAVRPGVTGRSVKILRQQSAPTHAADALTEHFRLPRCAGALQQDAFPMPGGAPHCFLCRRLQKSKGVDHLLSH